MPKLTETFVKKTKLQDSGTRKIWDNEIKGLGLFIGKKSRTWYFQKDVGGRTKRVLIGRYPVISADAARLAAQTLLLEMSRGAGKAFQARTPTLERAMETYLARPKLRSERGILSTRQQLNKHLSEWMHLPLDEITRPMVVAKHGELSAIPSGANHTFRSFRSIWNHARRTVDLPESPTIAIEWYPEPPNGTIIDDLQAWRHAIDNLENPIHASFYRLLLLTGFRRNEAQALRWKDVQADHIHLPMTKNGRAFSLPITPHHLEVLEPMRGLDRTWVFPARRSTSGHIQNAARLEWSAHAHRRTFATVAMEAGVLEEIVGRLLNHTPQSITGHRYVRPSIEALRPSMKIAVDELCDRVGWDTQAMA